jgi:hypothetical protein
MAAKSGPWSDAGTWGGKLPSPGQDIMIDPGISVTYDLASSPNYGSITVMGSLVFSHARSTSISFQNMSIMPGGYVELGTTNDPVPFGVSSTLYLNAAKEGNAGIMVMGRLEIHGAPIGSTFSKLAATVQSGATTLAAADKLQWKAGDHIVVTSTSLFPWETEENAIASISGNTINLARPLTYPHDGVAPAQGEVADLTRNVVVTSLNQSVHAMGIMFMFGAKGGITYAEFSHLGGLGILGNYPIHFHHVQNSMPGTVVRGVSVWDSHNRFITIHNTDNIRVENSVGFLSVGHGFFLEDGTEENNTLTRNLAIMTLPGAVRPDDGASAGFWVQNPRNNLTGNIAVSNSGSGFDYSLTETAPIVIPFNLPNFQASLNQATTPTTLTVTAFAKNEAHSNADDGFHQYRLDMGTKPFYNVFSDLNMWRNGNLGVEVTASPAVIRNSLVFGNQLGNMQVDSYNMTISRATVMGELPGISKLMNSTNAGMERYLTSPFGLVSMATYLTIVNSTFNGHATQGNVASADIINQQNGWATFSVFLSNTFLSSKHPIIFGYPLSGDSYIRVAQMNGNATMNFVLYRYDTSPGPTCSFNASYMAMQCWVKK